MWKTQKIVPFLSKNTHNDILQSMSVTYQPKKKKRAKVHGFLARSKTSYGKRVILRRIRKGRKKVTTV